MFKKLYKLLVLALIMLTLSVPAGYGSGKMEVKLGSKVTLQGESKIPGANFKWITKKGNEIVNTQTNRIFSYTFISAGSYKVNLTATGRSGEVENTTIELLVGDRYPRPSVPVTDSGIFAVKVGEDGVITRSDGKTLTLSTESQIITESGEVIEVRADGRMLTPDGEFVTLNTNGKLETADGRIFEISKSSQFVTNDGSYLNFSPTGQILSSNNPNLQFSPTGEVITADGQVLSVGSDGQVLEIRSTGDTVPQDGLGRATRIAPLKLEVSTLPPMNESGTVHLLGESKVSFYLGNSTGEILEYRIDRNIFIDDDGNGNANDDIDNADDNSYLTGANFETVYSPDESAKVVAEITLVDKSGKKAKKQIEFVFDPPLDKDGDPIAKFDVSPAPSDKDGFVYVYGDKAEVGFYAKKSPGSIIEYRIDKNIFFDSDGDGDPANDIDNRNDDSFRTGDLWTTSYNKTDDQIIAQLIVVSASGKGSRVQVGIKFAEKPEPNYVTVGGSGAIRLTADKDFVLKGDPITFTVTGLTLDVNSYSFAWDFDGDGVVDKETEGQNVIEHIYEVPGAVDASVQIVDADGNSGTRTLAMVVKESIETIADFTYNVDGNKVEFSDASTASIDLANKNLTYKWSFGDPDEENFISQSDQVSLANPSYVYKKAGTYLVTLTITDAEDVVNSRSEQIVIDQDLAATTPAIPSGEATDVADGAAFQVTGQPASGGAESASAFKVALKVILYVIIVAIALVILIFGGLLVLLKVQNPDLTFDELSEEVRMKLLGMLGVHDLIEESPSEVPSSKDQEIQKEEVHEDVQEAEVVEAPAPQEQPVAEPPVAEPPVAEPPVAEPEKIAGREVIETTEVPETPTSPTPTAPTAPSPAPQAPTTPPQAPSADPNSGPTPEAGSSDEQGPVPDWLKGV